MGREDDSWRKKGMEGGREEGGRGEGRGKGGGGGREGGRGEGRGREEGREGEGRSHKSIEKEKGGNGKDQEKREIIILCWRARCSWDRRVRGRQSHWSLYSKQTYKREIHNNEVMTVLRVGVRNGMNR